MSWDTARFHLLNMTEKEVDMDSVCKPVKPGHVLIPDRRPFESLAGLCKRLGGLASTVTSEDMQRRLSEVIMRTESCAVPWSK